MKLKKKPLLFVIGLLPGCVGLMPMISSSVAENASDKLETKFTLHKENISNSEFNVTLKSNDIPCDYTGSYLFESILTPSNKKIGYNYSEKTVEDFYLTKKGENYYRIYLNSASANSGDIYTFSGEYTNPTGIKVNVLTSQFKYDGSQFVTYEPEISIAKTENIVVEGDVIYVNTGTSKDELVASISNGFSGTISYSYPNGSLSNSKFVSNNGSTTYDNFYIYCQSNGYSFRYDYKLVVGYKEFIMQKGAGLSIDDSSALEFKANISETILKNAKEIGFLAVKKEELGENDFNADCLFKNNKLFVFNKDVTNKIRVEKRYAFASYNFDGSYTLSGRLDNINNKDYLTSYLATFYIKTEYGYFLASNYKNDISNSVRSVVGVASRAVSNADTNSDILQNKYLNGNNEVSYQVRYISKDNGAILKQNTFKGNINEEITLTCDEIVIGGTSYKTLENKSITQKLFDNDISFDFYLTSSDNSVNIYAYDCPYLSSSNHYDNDFNKKVCADLVKYGFTGVIYSGQTISTKDNVDALKDIINMFYKNGLKTIINDRSHALVNYHLYDGVPDFSDCLGFAGLLSWDEPSTDDAYNIIRNMASSYDSIYKNKLDSKFITTLLPSYGVDSFKDYVENYIDIMNNNISDNELKSLCTDYYPFTYNNNVTSMRDTYVRDLLYLRSKATENNATPFIIMQLSSVDGFARASYYSEMLLQSYMALSFGYRNLVWYKTFSTDETSLFVKESGVDANYNQNYHVTNSTSLDVLHINREITNKANLIKDYKYVGTYLSSILGNYSLKLYNSYMSDRLTSLPKELTISSNDKYHVGVYKNSDGKYAYIISSYINNDGNYSIKIKVNNSFTAYKGDNSEVLVASNQYSFDSLTQGVSIVLI